MAKGVSLGPNVGTVRVSPERLLWATTSHSDLHSPNGSNGSRGTVRVLGELPLGCKSVDCDRQRVVPATFGHSGSCSKAAGQVT